MTRLDLTRLPASAALQVTRKLLRHAPEGLQAIVRHPHGGLVYTFGSPWPGGRGPGARPLQVYRVELGPPGETCPLDLPLPPARQEPWRDPGPLVRYWLDERGDRVRLPRFKGRL